MQNEYEKYVGYDVNYSKTMLSFDQISREQANFMLKNASLLLKNFLWKEMA